MSKRQKYKARGRVTQKLTRGGLVERNATTGEEALISKRSADFDPRGANAVKRTLLRSATRPGGGQSKKYKRRVVHGETEAQDKQNTGAEAEAAQSQPLQFTTSETIKLEEASELSHSDGNETPSKSNPPANRQAQCNTSYKAGEQIQTNKQSAVPITEEAKHKPRPPNSPFMTDSGETFSAPRDSAVEIPAEDNESPLSESAETPPHTDKADIPLKAGRRSKLLFASDEADAKPEDAKARPPTKKPPRTERVFNEEKDKPKRGLYFESELKPRAELMKGAKQLRPVNTLGNTALAFGHRKMYQAEQENAATEAAHKGEMAAETVVRSALRHHKAAPYRKAAKPEQAAKKSINLACQRTLAENPKQQGNVLSRAFQKRRLKKDYIKAAREAQKTAKRAQKAGSAAGGAGKAIAGAVSRHPAASAVIIIIVFLLFALTSLIGSFGSMGGGGLGGVLQSSYLAGDADIDNAELAYTEWETDLLTQIAETESVYNGYDEYRYSVGGVSHNPYELMAYLTVKYQNFTYSAIEAGLRSLFAEQYALEFNPSTETRYADPSDNDGDGDYEPYDWNVLTVSLTARSFTDVAASYLSGDEAAHFALLMRTKGGRQYLANPFGGLNWIPYVSSYYGYRIHPIDGGRNYHKGVDIALPQGTEILSGQDGTVTFAGYSGDYGNVVVIEDGNGLVSKYAHCGSLLVSTGQAVMAGEAIAAVGNTGASTGAHLHLEIIKNGQYLNALYFAGSGDYSSSPEYGDPGPHMGNGVFAAMMEVALLFEGWPYYWGGGDPETSFDCSGLVSYAVNQSGAASIGRTTAYGIYSVCTPVSPEEAMPGDLVFFHSTYSSVNPITHVGIYCGDNLMYDAGDPIGYTRIDTAYWQAHFYGFARIPE